MKKHSLVPVLFFLVGLSFGTFAQSKDELKLKSFYNDGNFGKCEQLALKLEKKSSGDELALAHLYKALSKKELIIDELYSDYDNKKPIRLVAVSISKYAKYVSDSVRSEHSELESKVVRCIEQVIINQLELKQYADAKYLADKLLDTDTLNAGAAIVLDFVELAEGGGEKSDKFNEFGKKSPSVSPKYVSFLTDASVLYAAWLTKEGKSDSAQMVAERTLELVGNNELLEVFK